MVAAILPHFERRFVREDFAIVDLKRSLAFARRAGKVDCFIGLEALAFLPDSGDAEDEALWRRYFAATENPARRNHELQRRLMPRRYWRFLPELAG